MVHAFIPSTWEAGSRGFLWDQDQHGPWQLVLWEDPVSKRPSKNTIHMETYHFKSFLKYTHNIKRNDKELPYNGGTWLLPDTIG